MRQGTRGTFDVSTEARKHISTLAFEHLSTQGTLTSKHAKHVSTQDTLAREHVSTQGTQFSRLNPDLSKQAQKVIFSRKTVKISYPSLAFNTVPVAPTAYQKHLVLYLDEKLSFSDHINVKISKENKGIGIIKKLSNTLPRTALLAT